MKPVVEVVCEGKIVRDGSAILEAHGSSTLVTFEDGRMIVDTSSWDYRKKVEAGLKRLGVRPEAIGLLVNTHQHGDHVDNNDLFIGAKRVSLEKGEDDRRISSGITLVSTPGHTRDSISVFVEGDVRYAIVGDAVPTVDNYRKWLPPGIHYDRDVALASMRRIVDFADVVIPGHGAPFHIDR